MISIIRHKQDLLTVSVIRLSKQLYTKLAHGGNLGTRRLAIQTKIKWAKLCRHINELVGFWPRVRTRLFELIATPKRGAARPPSPPIAASLLIF
jgi:hypothetical protein